MYMHTYKNSNKYIDRAKYTGRVSLGCTGHYTDR